MANLSSNIYEAEKDAQEVADWVRTMAQDRREARQEVVALTSLLRELVEGQHIPDNGMHVRASRLLRAVAGPED